MCILWIQVLVELVSRCAHNKQTALLKWRRVVLFRFDVLSRCWCPVTPVLFYPMLLLHQRLLDCLEKTLLRCYPSSQEVRPRTQNLFSSFVLRALSSSFHDTCASVYRNPVWSLLSDCLCTLVNRTTILSRFQSFIGFVLKANVVNSASAIKLKIPFFLLLLKKITSLRTLN